MIYDNRPKVFISSTISDFADLRSALGYILEKSGYRVYMSETTTFPVNPNMSNFDQCFELIDQCQYYVLLIGDKRGSWYHYEESTITQEEFRYARRKFEQTGDISLLTFIREDVWTAVNEYKSSGGAYKPENFQDIVFTKGFINEVTRDEEYVEAQQHGTPYPKGTWVSRFNRFSDIMDVLSITMNIETNRQMEILRSLALEELQENIRGCFDDYTSTGKAYPFANMLKGIIESKSVQGVKLPAKEVKDFATLGVLAFGMNRFKTKAIQSLLSSGELLDYDTDTRRYKKSAVMKLAEIMVMEIERIQGFFNSEGKSYEWYPRLDRLSKEARSRSEQDSIEIPEDLFIVLWMLSRTRVILTNAWYVYLILRHPERDYSTVLSKLDSEFYNFLTISGHSAGPVSLDKVQEWFENQGETFE